MGYPQGGQWQTQTPASSAGAGGTAQATPGYPPPGAPYQPYAPYQGYAAPAPGAAPVYGGQPPPPYYGLPPPGAYSAYHAGYGAYRAHGGEVHTSANSYRGTGANPGVDQRSGSGGAALGGGAGSGGANSAPAPGEGATSGTSGIQAHSAPPTGAPGAPYGLPPAGAYYPVTSPVAGMGVGVGVAPPPNPMFKSEDAMFSPDAAARKAFDTADRDKTGYIKFRDFLEALNTLTIRMPYHDALHTFSKLDADKDGQICETEFVNGYLHNKLGIRGS